MNGPPIPAENRRSLGVSPDKHDEPVDHDAKVSKARSVARIHRDGELKCNHPARGNRCCPRLGQLALVRRLTSLR